MLIIRNKNIETIEATLVEILSRRPLFDAISAMAEAELSIVTHRRCDWRLAKIIHYQLQGLAKAEALSILLNVQNILTARSVDRCDTTPAGFRNNQHPELVPA